MIDLVVLQSTSYMAAAIGVFVAAAYYVMTLRATQRNMGMTLETRKLQFITNTAQNLLNEEGMRRYGELMNMEWRDYDDFEKKYGSDFNLDNFAKRSSTWTMYSTFGALLREGLIDAETLYNSGLYGAFMVWNKFENVISEQRKRYLGEDYLADLEFLAREMLRIKLRKDPSFKIPETFIKYVSDE